MLNTKKDNLKNKTVVISGSGNVAQFAAEKCIQLGSKVVTMSDSSGYIYDSEGIDTEKLEYIMNLKNVERKRISEYCIKYPTSIFVNGETPWSIKCDIFVKCLVAICCVILSWTVAYGSYGDFQNIILDGSDTITIFPEGCEVSIEPVENGGLFPSLTLWEPRFNTLAPSTLRISEESTKVYVVTRRDGTFVNSTINDGRMSLSSSISSAPTKNASTSEVLADAAGVNREDGSGGLKCRVSVNVPANSQLKHVRIIQEGSGSSAVVKIKKTSIASLLVSVPESSTQLLINDARIENMTVHTTKLHVRMDQVEVVSSVHLLSSTLVGYADVLVRGDDGTMTVIEEVNHASNFKTCLRGGTLVAGVRTTTEQR
jgi:hypothetical protein